MANELPIDKAAHALRRAGFGGTPEEVSALASRGDTAIDYLLDYERIDNELAEKSINAAFSSSLDSNFFRSTLENMQKWWLSRMILSRRQFEEKMTLFWHNHFATSYSKVPRDLLYTQNLLFRAYGLGRFDDLLVQVAQDPAMLVWLDGINNTVDAVNENFSREVLELFTMGPTDVVTGEVNYTEKDVKEIARAFTGWSWKKKKGKYKFKIEKQNHDSRSKEIFGNTGNLGGEDVISMACSRRATARFLVKKLFEFFVYPLTTAPEDLATIEKFADVYVSSDHSIKAVVRSIFTSDEFFGERARFGLIKSPAEYISGAVRMSGAVYDPTVLAPLERNLVGVLNQMSMILFKPPDVSGWTLNLGWITTSTLFNRYNFARFLVTNRDFTGAQTTWPVLRPENLRKYVGSTARETVERFLTVFGPLKVTDETVDILSDYLEAADDGSRAGFVPDDQTLDKQVRGLVRLILCLPEFQMN